MDKTFNSQKISDYWINYWIENKTFKSKIDDKPSYTIVIPPPNITGILHMGHILNNSLQDFFIRKARKDGFNVLWVPGTDHAAIATEAKVVASLKEKGLNKSKLTREEFLSYCFEWKEKYGNIIIDQLKTIGCSCDFDRETFTMDPDYYKAVIRTFVSLHKKGYIYKGKKIINWDCEAKTALSNEEIIYSDKLEQSKLYHISYKIENSDDSLTIATTRPETIFADAAIAINSKDNRYNHLIGKKVLIPLINKLIPVIQDDYVDLDFGTGCLKVTPAHDINDYEIGLRHNLEIIDILNDDGSLNENCNYPKFIGKDRFEVKKLIINDLQEINQLVKVEDIENKIARSERTNSIVEPKLSLQWFVDMKNLSKTAHKVVMDNEIEFFPNYHKNSYNHWLTNIKDWCISRQLWWGHRIPAYYLPNGEYIVAESIKEALIEAKKIDPNIEENQLVQDNDVLDTWASSWIWPLQVFKGFDDKYFDKSNLKIDVEKNKELEYYLPTKILVTGPDIIFLWVMRMIISGYEFANLKPFEKVLFTGIVRDKKGLKMSKSLGNSPDLYEMISKYSLDGVRYGIMSASPAGNDIFFDEKIFEIGRNFANKLWNASILLKSWNPKVETNLDNKIITDWFEAKLQSSINSYLKNIENLRISEAFKEFYSFVWDDFCNWYLELIKPIENSPLDHFTLNKTFDFFKKIISILNPIMPVVTEEIYKIIYKNDDLLCDIHNPKIEKFNDNILSEAKTFFELIVKIRETKVKLKLKNIELVDLSIHKDLFTNLELYLPKLKKIAKINIIDTDVDNKSSNGFIIDNKMCFVNSDTIEEIDVEEIKNKISYFNDFINKIEMKLKNEKFINSAPPKVIEIERKKVSDSVEKIKSLEKQLEKL